MPESLMAPGEAADPDAVSTDGGWSIEEITATHDRLLENQLQLAESQEQLSKTLAETTKQLQAVAQALASKANGAVAARHDEASGEIIAGRNPSYFTMKATEVEVQLVVERIFDLSTIDQVFGAQLHVTLLWECPPTETPPKPSEDDGDWEPAWTPKFHVHNLMEEIFARQTYTVKKINDRSMIEMDSVHLVRIYEQLELHSFPCDLQDLTILILSTMPMEAVRWLPPKSSADGCFARLDASRTLLNDFGLVQECPYTYCLGFHRFHDNSMSTVEITVKVARKANYYMMNVALVMFCIVSFVFCAWGLHPADMGGRHGVDFNLILTAVAFKLVLSGMLPNVSYVTNLDIYVMAGFFFLMCITVTHTVLPLMYFTHLQMSAITTHPMEYEGEQNLIDMDMLVFWVFLAVWVFWNITYFAVGTVAARKRYVHFWKEGLEKQKQFDPEHLQTKDMRSSIWRSQTSLGSALDTARQRSSRSADGGDKSRDTQNSPLLDADGSTLEGANDFVQDEPKPQEERRGLIAEHITAQDEPKPQEERRGLIAEHIAEKPPADNGLGPIDAGSNHSAEDADCPDAREGFASL